jgi:hypothetical protein
MENKPAGCRGLVNTGMKKEEGIPSSRVFLSGPSGKSGIEAGASSFRFGSSTTPPCSAPKEPSASTSATLAVKQQIQHGDASAYGTPSSR